MILNNKFYPIDTTVGFVKGNIADVSNFIIEWYKCIGNPFDKIEHKNYTGDIENAIADLLPLTTVQIRRTLILSNSSNWVAYLNNSILGTDTSGLAYIAKKLKTSCIGVTETLSSDELGYKINSPHAGTTFFDYDEFSSDGKKSKERWIHAINEDGNWKFEVSGELLPFENPEQFKARKIKDRFNRHHLLYYLEYFGIKLNDPNFFSNSRAVLIARVGPPYPSEREFSLEEARHRYD